MPKESKNGFKRGHKFYKGGEKGWFKKGITPWNKGLKNYMVGEKNPAWKGGHSVNARKKFWATHPNPGQCEICGIFEKDLKRKLCFDHDHITGNFRGWLCGRCNIALGMVRDNTGILLAMIEYIKKYDNNSKTYLD